MRKIENGAAPVLELLALSAVLTNEKGGCDMRSGNKTMRDGRHDASTREMVVKVARNAGLRNSWAAVMSRRLGVLALLVGLSLPAMAYTIKYVYTLSSGAKTVTDGSYSTSATDTSGVYVTGAGQLTLVNPTVTTSGNTSSMDDSSFYGLNAGILADGSSSAVTITNGTITTSGTGANGLFATNGATVTATGLAISCTGKGGHGVDATLKGVMNLTNCTATSTGANGSIIATDRGSGTITVVGGTYKASGADSAGIYSTGVITATGATITATGAEAIVVEGGNSAAVTNCVMTAAKGTRDRGVFVYNSQSGDAEAGTGVVTMTGGSYTWPSTSGPAFYVTNTTGVITLDGVTVNNSSSSLISAAADQWGTSGSNGGKLTFTAKNETLTGSMVADSVSSIAASLQNSTTWTGYATSAALTLDSTSVWNVSAGSTVTSLANSGTVKFSKSGLTVTDSGAYTSGSSSRLEYYLGGDSSYDSLAVTGSATLAGTLCVSLDSSYTPAVGKTFTIMTRGSGSGSFDTLTTNSTGLAYTVAYNTTSVVITITAVPSGTTYTLTYTAGANGTLTGSTTQTVASGGSGTAVTAVPNSGYSFSKWSDGSTSNPRTDTNVTANISVTASFVASATTYTLTYTAGSNGTLTGSTTQTVASGGSGTAVTAVPNSGYSFSKWSDGSTSNPRTDTNVTANISVTASFVASATTYTLTYAAGSNGTLTGSTTQTVASGGSGTAVTAVPNSGYSFSKWSDDSTSNPRTDTNVTANISVTASFVASATTYTLTYTAGANGTLTGSTTQTVASGGSGTAVTAVPNSGYSFSKWSDDSTSNPRTDTNVTANISVTASFVASATTYTLTYTAGANGTLTGTTTQTVASGGSGTAVTAVPNTGYYFANWSDGSTNNPRTDANVIADISVTASFEVSPSSAELVVRDNGVIVPADGTVDLGTSSLNSSEAVNRTLVVENIGGASATLTSLTLPSGFEATGLPATVDAGASASIIVTMQTATPGIFGGDALLSIEGAASFEFALLGSVLAAGESDTANFRVTYKNISAPVVTKESTSSVAGSQVSLTVVGSSGGTLRIERLPSTDKMSSKNGVVYLADCNAIRSVSVVGGLSLLATKNAPIQRISLTGTLASLKADGFIAEVEAANIKSASISVAPGSINTTNPFMTRIRATAADATIKPSVALSGIGLEELYLPGQTADVQVKAKKTSSYVALAHVSGSVVAGPLLSLTISGGNLTGDLVAGSIQKLSVLKMGAYGGWLGVDGSTTWVMTGASDLNGGSSPDMRLISAQAGIRANFVSGMRNSSGSLDVLEPTLSGSIKKVKLGGGATASGYYWSKEAKTAGGVNNLNVVPKGAAASLLPRTDTDVTR